MEALRSGVQGPLTLISAPAGYGKSVLVASWAEGAGASPLMFLQPSRDEGDDSPSGFWTSVLDGLHDCDIDVTGVAYDASSANAQAKALRPDVILCSFGDMLRVPGSHSDLLAAKSQGAQVRIVYSPLDALDVARGHPDREVVFFAVGFETTAPANAMAVFQAPPAAAQLTDTEAMQAFTPLLSSIVRIRGARVATRRSIHWAWPWNTTMPSVAIRPPMRTGPRSIPLRRFRRLSWAQHRARSRKSRLSSQTRTPSSHS